jgi:hypothetical protein
MKKMLVCGTSFSDKSRNPKIKKWPEILSEKINFELKNISSSGISNRTIFNNIFVEIEKEKYDLIVVSWSYSLKTNIFNALELNFINIDESGDKFEKQISEKISKQILQNEEKILKAFEDTLISICLLQNLCENRGIMLIHYPLLNIFHLKEKNPSILSKIKENYFFKKISKFENILGWPCDDSLNGYSYNMKYKGLTISKLDRHPNSIGQELVSQELYEFYEKLRNKK